MKLRITAELEIPLKETLVDILVFSKPGIAASCNIFNRIAPDLGINYVLKNYNTGSCADFSINRCSPTTVPYLPNSFKFGNPSPNKQNDCSGEKFILYDQAENAFEEMDLTRARMPEPALGFETLVAYTMSQPLWVKVFVQRR